MDAGSFLGLDLEKRASPETSPPRCCLCPGWAGSSGGVWESGSGDSGFGTRCQLSGSQTDVSSFSSASSVRHPKREIKMGSGQARLCLLQPLKWEMKSFIFLPPPCCGLVICIYLLVLFLDGMNHLFGAGGRISLSLSTLPPPPQSILCWFVLILPAEFSVFLSYWFRQSKWV